MKRFQLIKLIVSSENFKESIINFSPGLNFILGPSNTGKTLLVEYIDYVLGGDSEKVKHNNFGYYLITLELQTSNNYIVSLSREINNSKITVTSNDPSIKSGTYSKNKDSINNINTILLSLIGINEIPKILRTQKGETSLLSWRAIRHLFLLKQDNIDANNSILLNPSGYNGTLSPSALLYLINRYDANEIIKQESPEIQKAKKESVTFYINKQIDYLHKKKHSIEKLLSENENTNIDKEISIVKDSLIATQNLISETTLTNTKIFENIQNKNDKLIKNKSIINSFISLEEQYHSDIDRLNFIISGHTHISPNEVTMCPICSSKVKNPIENGLVISAKAELQKLNTDLYNLSLAKNTIQGKIDNLNNELAELNIQKEELDKKISAILSPKLDMLKNELDTLIKISTAKGEINNINVLLELYQVELEKQEQEITTKEIQYKIKEKYTSEILTPFKHILKNAIIHSKFENTGKIDFNLTSFDIELNNKPKTSFAGGGYTSVLNTLTAFCMFKYLLENNGLAPNFFIVDSALSQLSETEFKDDSLTIKTGFLDYLYTNSENKQIILIEHKEKIPKKFLKYKDINIIEFTKDKNHDRYGFLNNVDEYSN